jgi:hypothetical protein
MDSRPELGFRLHLKSQQTALCGEQMFTPDRYRDKAAEYSKRGKNADGSKEARRFARLEKSFTTLADNEQWLSENHQRTVQTAAVGSSGGPSSAEQEEHSLRCLGAAVIMEWSSLPSNVRRQLFDCATTMGDALEIAPLRKRITRFLHKHQNAQRIAGDR